VDCAQLALERRARAEERQRIVVRKERRGQWCFFHPDSVRLPAVRGLTCINQTKELGSPHWDWEQTWGSSA
jgi:hypothetical protein